MSAPKKKDLSALKARLAKKAAPAADIPAPGEVASPPQPEPAPAAPAADIPPPGQSLPNDIPAPGEVAYEPEPEPVYEAPAEPAYQAYEEPAAAAAPLSEDGDIYTGGSSFDPSAGLIGDDTGGVPSRSGTGLALTALGGGVLIGALLGFFGAEVSNKRSMADNATAKAMEMLKEVERVKETRTKISLQFEDVVKEIDKDPKAASEKLTALLVESFGPDSDFPKVESLFGWQLASLHPKSVRTTFSLYKASQDLVVDMGFLAQYINANAEVIGGRGPKTYAVVMGEGGAVLVEYAGAVCGETEGDDPKPVMCEAGKEGDATAVMIRENPGGPTGALPVDQVQVLQPKGAIYQYAIGDHPEQNAANLYKGLAARVQERLDAMAKYEKSTLSALAKYGDNPTTDDDSAQSDPGE